MVDDIYREQVMDHFKNPRNFGSMEDASVVVKERNASCGDEIEISLKFQRHGGTVTRQNKIDEIKFKGTGCAISIAFSSLLIERVLGEKFGVEELKKMSEDEIVKMIGGERVSPARQKCLRLPIKALRRAIE